jgi:hypothetical protein
VNESIVPGGQSAYLPLTPADTESLPGIVPPSFSLLVEFAPVFDQNSMAIDLKEGGEIMSWDLVGPLPESRTYDAIITMVDTKTKAIKLEAANVTITTLGAAVVMRNCHECLGHLGHRGHIFLFLVIRRSQTHDSM